MFSIYKGKKYDCNNIPEENKVKLFSSSKDDGFINHTDPWGNYYDDFFSKTVDIDDLDYLYDEKFQIKYKGRFFRISSAINKGNIERNWFEIYVSLEERELGISLGFIRTDKFLWSKEIGREEIEAFKIIEIPIGPFSDQGSKETILEGQAIDDYFATIEE